MFRNKHFTRKLKLGGVVAMAATAALACGAAAAQAAPAKGPTDQTATAAHAEAIGAVDSRASASKRRKRCKRPKVAIRRRGRIRCVRPKQAFPAPKAVPSPQQVAPQGSAPDTQANTGGSTTAEKPTEAQTSALQDTARSVMTLHVGSNRSWEPMGCVGAWLHAEGFWYGYCDFLLRLGPGPGSLWPIGQRDWYWWNAQLGQWSYWYSTEFVF